MDACRFGRTFERLSGGHTSDGLFVKIPKIYCILLIFYVHLYGRDILVDRRWRIGVSLKMYLHTIKSRSMILLSTILTSMRAKARKGYMGENCTHNSRYNQYSACET